MIGDFIERPPIFTTGRSVMSVARDYLYATRQLSFTDEKTARLAYTPLNTSYFISIDSFRTRFFIFFPIAIFLNSSKYRVISSPMFFAALRK